MEHKRPNDLRERQAEHGHVHVRQPHAEPTEQRGPEARDHRSHGQRQPHRRIAVDEERRRTVGPEAKVRRVAEGDHAPVAHDEVQARREQREDEHLGEQDEIELLDPKGRRDQEQQHRADRQARPAGRDAGQGLLSRIDPRDLALRPAEQSPGPDHQHDGHHQEHEHQRNLREHQDAERVQLADDHRGEERTHDAAHSADHHDDEDGGDDGQIHMVADRGPGELQRASEAREDRAEEEHGGEQQRLVDPERAQHLPVFGRGPHQGAPASTIEQQPQPAEDGEAQHDQHQVVLGDLRPEDVYRPVEPCRLGPELVLRAPDVQCNVLDEQDDTEGRHELEQLRRPVDPPQDEDLRDHSDDSDREGGQNDRTPEAECSLG